MSSQIRIRFPLPVDQRRLSWMMYAAFWHRFQIGEGFLGLGITIGHLSLFPFRYFFLNASFHLDLFLEIIFQTILAPNAKFFAARYLILVPPLSFDLHTVSHLMRWNLFVPLCFLPYQRKRLSSFSISCIIDLGAREIGQENIGYTTRTTLMRINFPVGLSQLAPRE